MGRDSPPLVQVWVDHYTGDAWCSFKDEGVRPLDKARDLCAEVAAIELCPCGMSSSTCNPFSQAVLKPPLPANPPLSYLSTWKLTLAGRRR